ncbi:DNA polymerase III subunit chi [Paludibacterium yongneupense]|uniref:DNA polymerase III subunit chi n=1 Tax=Paludibacterium yongneupense TaxID=400061 RepID=UPI00041A0561|nr:DNA polymerase III subunit chi [Paludibacterium yongneupense]
MTRIDFYTQVDDPQGFACRLAQTVFRKGERLLILFDDREQQGAFSRRLWSLGDTLFVPHCAAEAAEAADTPLWLGCVLPDSELPSVLLNLGRELPDRYHEFSRILEIVGRDETSLAVARERFRVYRARGCAIEHHDMSHA